jgi:hypothetical protein
LICPTARFAAGAITAALQAGIANIEAVMIAGRWRKRH